MRRIAFTLLAGAGAMALAACGSSDDASVEAEADTVEMPADAALDDISDVPVEDPDANAAGATVSEEMATDAADAAADVAAAAEAAADTAADEAADDEQ